MDWKKEFEEKFSSVELGCAGQQTILLSEDEDVWNKLLNFIEEMQDRLEDEIYWLNTEI